MAAASTGAGEPGVAKEEVEKAVAGRAGVVGEGTVVIAEHSACPADFAEEGDKVVAKTVVAERAEGARAVGEKAVVERAVVELAAERVAEERAEERAVEERAAGERAQEATGVAVRAEVKGGARAVVTGVVATGEAAMAEVRAVARVRMAGCTPPPR